MVMNNRNISHKSAKTPRKVDFCDHHTRVGGYSGLKRSFIQQLAGQVAGFHPAFVPQAAAQIIGFLKIQQPAAFFSTVQNGDKK